MKTKTGKIFFLLLLTTLNTAVYASTYALPPVSESLIGKRQIINAARGDNVINVAARFDIGFNAIQANNPQLEMTRGFPLNSTVVIATDHLLPNAPREGIVVNLPEMRIYYYPEGSEEVLTYPIGIGKIGKTIPIIETAITYKRENPTWTPPEDIRDYNLEKGIVLPKVMPAGPDNPLGKYAIYMKIPTYLMHSTIYPESIGTRASFGCLRMYESDIQNFFPSITSGIPVLIVNMPTKIGWQDDYLYLEVHQPLEEHSHEVEASLSGVVNHVIEETKNHPALIDWQAIAFIAKVKDGAPHNIGMFIS